MPIRRFQLTSFIHNTPSFWSYYASSVPYLPFLHHLTFGPLSLSLALARSLSVGVDLGHGSDCRCEIQAGAQDRKWILRRDLSGFVFAQSFSCQIEFRLNLALHVVLGLICVRFCTFWTVSATHVDTFEIVAVKIVSIDIFFFVDLHLFILFF